jgi:hypothetical protein
MTSGEIARYSLPGGSGGETKRLAFSDTDLGPGGAFVTRWGTDPIRKGTPPDGWLVPREVFGDYGSNGVGFAENVFMPLPAEDSAAPAGLKQTVSLIGDPPQSMRVSLMTYEPRFDPVQALWYVDLALDPLDLPEPFVRLGLVRYQEHAAEHLQVSEPIAEWIQLFPSRSVSVQYKQPRLGERGVPLEIKVRGRGSLRTAVEGDIAVDQSRQAMRDRPIMRAELSRRRRIGDGPHFKETVVTDANEKPVAAADTNARRSSGGLTWTLRLLIPSDEDPRKAIPEKTSYHVFVEEILSMLPASGTPGAPDEDIATGPRFAVSLDLVS